MFASFTPGCQSRLHRRNCRRKYVIGFNLRLCCHNLAPRLPPQVMRSRHRNLPQLIRIQLIRIHLIRIHLTRIHLTRTQFTRMQFTRM